MGELVEIKMGPYRTLEVDVDDVQAIVTVTEQPAAHMTTGVMPGAFLVYLRGREHHFEVRDDLVSAQQIDRIRDLKNNPEGIDP